MKPPKFLLVIGVLLFPLISNASSKFIVEAVQMPAWLDRYGTTEPVEPGMKLEAGDRLRTGESSRLLLALPEGSAVKLGGNAVFSIDEAKNRRKFRATLSMMQGAFRFTTDALSRSELRDVAIQVSSVTLGIRGTDVWGKSSDSRDIVCLIEGQITVGSAGNPVVTLKDPSLFYQKPRNGAPLPVGKADAEKLRGWLQETEIEADGAVSKVEGEWSVIAAAFDDRSDAKELREKLRDGGYPAEIERDNGRYDVRISNLAGETEAIALASQLKLMSGVSAPSVMH